MAYENRVDLDTRSIVVQGARVRGGYTLLTDAVVYAKYTLLAQVTASGKLVPFTDETAVDGSKVPKFILVNEIDAIAGDVDDVQVYEVGEFYSDFLVIRNSKTLATKIDLATNYSATVRQALAMWGIIFREQVAIDGPENA